MEEKLKLEDLEKYESLRELISTRGDEIITYKQKHDKEFQKQYCSNGSVGSFEILTNSVTFKVEEYWSYGGYDYHHIEINNELLCADNWLEILTKETEENNKVFLEKKAKQEADIKKAKLAEAKRLVKELSK